jgi:hypothetical protein
LFAHLLLFSHLHELAHFLSPALLQEEQHVVSVGLVD